MYDLDAHVQTLRDNLTELSSLDRINRIREDWQAYVTGIEEMKLHHNTLGLKIVVLLSKWEAEECARRSFPAIQAVCRDCGAQPSERPMGG